MSFIRKITFSALILFLLGSFTLPLANEGGELKWYDWNEGIIKAKAEGKVALIDTYTDWCHWCKVMDKNTYTNKTVVDLINAKFVPIKFNPELDKKYYNGKDTLTGRQLLYALSGGNSSGYPTTYFYLPIKNVMYQEAGYIEPVKFESLLRGVLAEHEK